MYMNSKEAVVYIVRLLCIINHKSNSKECCCVHSELIMYMNSKECCCVHSVLIMYMDSKECCCVHRPLIMYIN